MRKKFIFSLIIILFFVIDRGASIGAEFINANSKDFMTPKLNYLMNETKDDVVFWGTSRCQCHYVPDVISDSLRLTVYNAGVDASDNIFAHYIVLNMILSHHNPKMVCLEIMPSDYDYREESINAIRRFAPYIGFNKEIDNTFYDTGALWKYRLSHLYRYSQPFLQNLVGLLFDFKGNEHRGYYPLEKPFSLPQYLDDEIIPERIDEKKLLYIQKFIDACSSRNIKLVFFVSPKYRKASHGLYEPIQSVARDNKIPFYDYHSSGLFQDNPDLFRDYMHLWDKGARLYSSIIASNLKKEIN